jgi:5-methyltetrahydrofolate--homocysteine methyltransferase
MVGQFLTHVRSGRVAIGDGAWGSLLIERGLRPGEPPELWTLEHPDVLASIARDYLEAGAEILTTNTFGGSPLRLSRYGLAARTEEINARAAEVALRAADGRAWVSASIGPTGLLLKPLGDLEPDAAHESFERQIRALVAAGVDVLCIETMTDLAEATLAIRAARAVTRNVPVIATMTFEVGLSGASPATVMGVGVERASVALVEAGADVVGANCGRGVAEMAAVARAFSACSPVPISLRPNAGLPRHEGGRMVYSETPEQFAAAAAELLQAGVWILGGCCGTTPAHIRAVAEVVRATRDVSEGWERPGAAPHQVR